MTLSKKNIPNKFIYLLLREKNLKRELLREKSFMRKKIEK